MCANLSRWLGFALCCMLVACALRAAGQQQPSNKKQASASKEPPPTWTVEGWGKTVEDAEKHALQKVREKLGGLLESPPPDENLVRKLFFTGTPERCPQEDKEIK